MDALRLLVWRALPGVRPGERGRFLFFAGLSGILSAALTLGLAGSEALFLARVGADALPRAFVLAAFTTVGASLAYAVVVGRARNDVVFLWMLLTGALALAGATVGIARGAPFVFHVVFSLFFVAQAIYTNHFWTFATDYFDALASKRLFPLFLIGNSLGGAVGGALVVLVSEFAPAEVLVASWGAGRFLAALLLRAARRPLRRWGPLELAEGDETSVAGIRGALRFIAREGLARWLVVSVLAMTIALFVTQYLYSEIFARQFPEAESLASFLGAFLAVTNLLEIGVAVAITPWLIGRLGVASANLVHPVLSLVSFVGLAIDFSLWPAIAARSNRELLENSMADPVRTLVYNAVPLRFRGRLRLFLEGVVRYGAIALAGAALLAFGGRLEPRALCAFGGGLALLYLLANLWVRGAYLRTLVRELRSGRLDVSEIGADLGGFEVARLADLWERLLASETHPGVAELELAGVLARRGVLDPVLRAARHPSARVRRACIEAVGGISDTRVPDVLRAALEDPDAEVRIAATAAAARTTRSPVLEKSLRARLADPDPRARAEAAAACGGDGLGTLREMLGSDASTDVRAALARAPVELLPLVLAHATGADALLRAEAIACAARLGATQALDGDALLADLARGDARARAAVAGALAGRHDPAALAALVAALADASHPVREIAARGLAALGPHAVRLVAPVLAAPALPTLAAAADALELVGTPRARAALVEEIGRRVRQGWEGLLALRMLPERGDLATLFLRAAFADRVERSRRAAFALLERVDDARVMRTVDKVLRFGSPRARGDALEVLSNLGDREAAALLVLQLEDGLLEDKLVAVAASLRVPDSAAEVVAAAREAPDPWLRLGAHPRPGPIEEERMERLLVLREVPLFAGLSLDQLEAVNRLVRETRWLAGEIVLREGDLGNELYVLVSGELRVYRSFGTPQQILLNTLHPVSAVGEMGVLADAPRLATNVVAVDSTLLVLDGEHLKDLILQVPEISFEIFRVLTARVRAAEERLQAASDPPR